MSVQVLPAATATPAIALAAAANANNLLDFIFSCVRVCVCVCVCADVWVLVTNSFVGSCEPLFHLEYEEAITDSVRGCHNETAS